MANNVRAAEQFEHIVEPIRSERQEHATSQLPKNSFFKYKYF